MPIPLVYPDPAGNSTPTALEYIHTLAEETAEFGMGVTSSTGTTSTLVFSTFINSTLSATEFAGMFVLIEDGVCAGEVGHVKGGGLARGTGTITTADNFSAPIVAGVAFSLYRLFPPIREGVLPGLLQIINQSLRRMSFPDRISFDGVTGQRHFTIDNATYPWWTDEKRIMWVEYPVTNADDPPRRMPDNHWDWLADAETRRLFFSGGSPANTGQTFTVRVMRPGNSRLKLSGVWADQTTQTAGLLTITDCAILDVSDVVTVAKARLFEMLSNMQAPGTEVAEWLAKASPNIRAARDLIHRATNEDRTAGVVSLRPSMLRSGYGRGWR